MSDLSSDYYGTRGQSLLFRIPDVPVTTSTPSLSASKQLVSTEDRRLVNLTGELERSSRDASPEKRASEPTLYGIVVEPNRATATSAVLRCKTVHLSYSEERNTSRSVSTSTASSARFMSSRPNPPTKVASDVQPDETSMRSFSASSSNCRSENEIHERCVGSGTRPVTHSSTVRTTNLEHDSEDPSTSSLSFHVEEATTDIVHKPIGEVTTASKRPSVYDRLYSLRKGKKTVSTAIAESSHSTAVGRRTTTTTTKRESHIDVSASHSSSSCGRATVPAPVSGGAGVDGGGAAQKTTSEMKTKNSAEKQCRIEPVLESTARPSQVVRKITHYSSEDEVEAREVKGAAISSEVLEITHVARRAGSGEERSPSSSVVFSTAASVVSSCLAAPARPPAPTEPIAEVSHQRFVVGRSDLHRASEPFSEASKCTSSSSSSSSSASSSLSSPRSPNPYSTATRRMTNENSVARSEGSTAELDTRCDGSTSRRVSEARTQSLSVMSPSPREDTTVQSETPCDRASTVPFESRTPNLNSRLLDENATRCHSKGSGIVYSPPPVFDVDSSSETEIRVQLSPHAMEKGTAQRVLPPPPNPPLPLSPSSQTASEILYHGPTEAATAALSNPSFDDVEDVEEIADDMVAEEKNAVNSCHAQWSSRNSRQYAAMIIQSYKSLRYTVRQRLLRRYYDKWFRIFSTEATVSTTDAQALSLGKHNSVPRCDRQWLEADDDNDDEGESTMVAKGRDLTNVEAKYYSTRSATDSESLRGGSSMRMFVTKSTNAALGDAIENRRYNSVEENSTRENMFEGPTSPWCNVGSDLDRSACRPYELASQQQALYERNLTNGLYTRATAEALHYRKSYESRSSSSGFSDVHSLHQSRSGVDVWSSARRPTTQPIESRSRDFVNRSHNSFRGDIRFMHSVGESQADEVSYSARSIGHNNELPEAQRSISPASFARVRGRPVRMSPAKLADHPHPCRPLPRPRYSLMRMEYPPDDL